MKLNILTIKTKGADINAIIVKELLEAIDNLKDNVMAAEKRDYMTLQDYMKVLVGLEAMLEKNK